MNLGIPPDPAKPRVKPRTAYRRILSAEWRAKGLCGNCGAHPPAPHRRACEICLDTSLRTSRRSEQKNPDAFRSQYHARKKAGLCVSCGSPENPRRARGLLCEGCSKTGRQRAVRTKAEVMLKYGGKCVCCGESRVAFLTIDHKNNDGTKMRKAGIHSGGSHFYKRLLTRPVDPSLQVMCWNCNLGRRSTGVCPHQDNSYYEEALNRPRWTRRTTLNGLGGPSLGRQRLRRRTQKPQPQMIRPVRTCYRCPEPRVPGQSYCRSCGLAIRCKNSRDRRARLKEQKRLKREQGQHDSA